MTPKYTIDSSKNVTINGLHQWCPYGNGDDRCGLWCPKCFEEDITEYSVVECKLKLIGRELHTCGQVVKKLFALIITIIVLTSCTHQPKYEQVRYVVLENEFCRVYKTQRNIVIVHYKMDGTRRIVTNVTKVAY